MAQQDRRFGGYTVYAVIFRVAGRGSFVIYLKSLVEKAAIMFVRHPKQHYYGKKNDR